MRCAVIDLDGRRYRYSDERHTSGRPVVIQFLNKQNVWRDVRNVDRSDQLWLEADQKNITPLYFDEVPHLLRKKV